MKRVRFIAPARREFLSEVAYYNGKEAGLGTRFAAAVEEATTRALAFPLTGSPASKSTRRVFVKDFPFAVVYRSDAEGIGRHRKDTALALNLVADVEKSMW